jgi:hypothetical protein
VTRAVSTPTFPRPQACTPRSRACEPGAFSYSMGQSQVNQISETKIIPLLKLVFPLLQNSLRKFSGLRILDSYLVTIFIDVNVKLFEGGDDVELADLRHRELLHGGAHLLVGDLRQHLDVTVEMRHHLTVVGDVLGEQQLVGGRVFAEPVLRSRARVHQRLGDHREATVDGRRLVDVEDEVRVFYEVHPKTQRKTKTQIGNEFSKLDKLQKYPF